MPKVAQSHLDARRQQILDAARTRFATHGFARTSLADIVAESGLSNGAIYRYFTSKDEIIVAICDQATSQWFPDELTAGAVRDFLDGIRARARDDGHARLVAQVYAEAAISPAVAEIVQQRLARLRDDVAALLPSRDRADAARIAEAFVAMCVGFNQLLAVRGDVDSAPFVDALMAIVDGPKVT
ncbi:TetR/AcrR family transcriptional regulator [Mycolicibacterium sediminis]|uniref:TetR family transcriptional regulator n=1 Tax=Mycolicibacterium sediminis TaxID=1286180 RepID=A0A7I7QKV2_9MYCO|nr:TetR family transcriptional regulator [Mycolicibacterium sediminis]BBY27009.1 TetR family transcriptional regulator [Mycolicibacterium sediminis]